MEFQLEKTIEILYRTPFTLKALLSDLSDDWVYTNEGPDTWSVFDVLGHLVHGERTDWIPRMELILAGKNETFPAFDRFAQFEESKGKTLNELLSEFEKLRMESVQKLKDKNLNDEQLEQTGMHPAFGKVKLKELLACWTAHDLDHIAQIARVMAKQYKSEVGPWVQYLGILHK